MSRTIRGARTTLVAIAMALLAMPLMAQANNAPSAVIAALNEQALPLVNAQDNASAELGRVLETHADVDSVLRRALGRRWTSLSDTQAHELKAQTLTLVSKAYASAMQGVSVDDITYNAKQATDTSARVGTTIAKGSNSIAVDYRLKPRDGGWKVVDVIISGISIVAVYSADFEAVLAHKGVDGLIAALRERNS